MKRCASSPSEIWARGEIFDKTGVPVRTQRDWKRRGLLRKLPSGWPENREWPGWTVDDLRDIHGFELEAWEGNLALIHTAEAQGNIFVPWFFRRLVELGREQVVPNGALDWALAIAGLPVLGHSLECLEPCEELTELIREHMPWENPIGLRAQLKRKDTPRARYLRAAKKPADALRSCLFMAQSLNVFKDLSDRLTTPTPILFAALHGRVPLFDRPRGLLLCRFNLGSIILGLLASAKEE